jgi:RES domain-containing protein
LALDVDPVDVVGTWLRHTSHGRDPRTRPVPPGNNRWQRGTVVDALYLADGEATMWAEWYRSLAELAVPPLHQLPRDVWRYRVRGLAVADLSEKARLARVGLDPPAPGRKTWPPHQRVGHELWREGWPGLLAPSAARPDGRVLCLFARDGEVPVKPSGRPRVVREPPAPPSGMRT